MGVLPLRLKKAGIYFIEAEKSPNGKSILVVSSEEDGVVKVYSTR
jgi:hypothetical protein